jgi:hypothetical protein
VVFNRIAEDVIVQSNIACDFAIPPAPEGREIELDFVAVSYTSGGQLVEQFGQASSVDACEANAFYISSNRIVLCPDTCGMIQQDPRSAVDVLFTCESQIIRQR